MLDYIFVILISFSISVLGTFFSIKLARKLNMMDSPGKIKIHSLPMPRLGGLGIFLGMAITCPFFILNGEMNGLILVPVISGAILIAVTGFIDDVIGLKPRQKIMGQALSALLFLLVFWAIYKLPVNFYFAIIFVFGFLFIMFMSNSFNLFDGMDGLTAGISSIIGLFFFVIAVMQDNTGVAILVISLVGACMGFLIFNRPPASIFMGDTGSLFLGYIIAVIVLVIFNSSFSVSKVLGLLLIISLPVTDTFLAIARRFLNGQKIFSGDRFHIYDCLYSQFGKENTWLTVSLMWLTGLVYGFLGMYVYRAGTTNAIVVFGISIAMLIWGANKLGSVPGLGQITSAFTQQKDQSISH